MFGVDWTLIHGECRLGRRLSRGIFCETRHSVDSCVDTSPSQYTTSQKATIDADLQAGIVAIVEAAGRQARITRAHRGGLRSFSGRSI